MRFKVLGPLRVWRANAELMLGPLQQRVVLAVLLLHANQPVGRGQLVRAVWGPSAPRYGVNQLQKHISGLRRLLEPERPRHGDSRILSWTMQGYLLTIPAGQLDLVEFDLTVKAARHAEEIPQQADMLHRALQVWRGPLCDGLNSPFLDAARDRLAERRLDVLEDRINADLALGQHAEVVAELRELVAEHPVRERLRGMLMLALYRCGRQAEALTAFQEAREHLREDLGVDPGPDLQQLQQRILRAEPALGTGPGAPGRPAQPSILPAQLAVPAQLPPPAQLPRGPIKFVGRTAQLKRLSGLLDPQAGSWSVMVATITGTAGVGKTALALHWAHQVRENFPDGQLYVNLRGFDPGATATDQAEAIQGFIDAFGVPPQLVPAGAAARTALYRSLLAGRQTLVVLDNARNADQVRSLLPGSPGCVVVVTSRDALVGLLTEGAVAVPVDLFNDAESHELLSRRLGQARVDAEPKVIEELVVASAGLPLALSVVAARLTAQTSLPLSALVEEIRTADGSLDLSDDADPAMNLHAMLSLSYQTLTPPAARLLRLLGLHPGPDITVPAAASLAGQSTSGIRMSLTELVRANLLSENAPGRYAFHSLIRGFAVKTGTDTDTGEDRQTALHRMFGHYLHAATAADRLLAADGPAPESTPPEDGVVAEPITSAEQAVDWFTATYPTLVAAVTLANDVRTDGYAWQIACALNAFLDQAGLWHEATVVNAVALAAAHRTGDPRATAPVHCSVARTCIRLGDITQAWDHLALALDLYHDTGDAAGQARVEMELARVAEMGGQDAVTAEQVASELRGQPGWQPGQQGRPLDPAGTRNSGQSPVRSRQHHAGETDLVFELKYASVHQEPPA